jgi:hypothetical protein
MIISVQETVLDNPSNLHKLKLVKLPYHLQEAVIGHFCSFVSWSDEQSPPHTHYCQCIERRMSTVHLHRLSPSLCSLLFFASFVDIRILFGGKSSELLIA